MNKPIIFFDGVCSLCNGFVDFIFRYDKNEKLIVASLQGETAKEKLDLKYIDDLNTIVLLVDGEIYTKSTAVLKALGLMGMPWSFLCVFLIIPKFLRDSIYNQISKNRYKLFGKKDSCRLPTESERKRFLK
jgi:predicted DCC family thiol-disulfide oxidoreductase YuxK